MTTIQKLLTAREWEQCLQYHYLRADGPNGNTPLDTLDATPSELGLAAGLEDLSDDDVLDAFMSVFSREAIRKVLGDEVSELAGFFAYRHFHFLVLTCVVSATTTNAGTTADFRKRLGVLLDDGGGQEQGVYGVNSLWHALAVWVDREIAKGKPYRRISLPDPGNMTRIGYAVRLAYPSRSDRSQLKSVLKCFPERALENRYALLQQLFIEKSKLPSRMQDDLKQMERLYRQNHPLEQHSLWRLIENVLTELSQDEPGRASLLWRISLTFGGWDGDEIEVSLARGNHRTQLDDGYWFGGFGELLSYSNAPSKVRKLLASGVLILHEVPGGLWIQDDRKTAKECRAVILTRLDDIVTKMPVWQAISEGWKMSEPMPCATAVELTGGAGVAEKETPEPAIRLEGGLSLGRKKWLNRPGFLPFINLNECRVVSTSPELALAYEDDIARLKNVSIQDGRWHIDAESTDSSPVSTTFQLIRNAPLATRWSERSGRHEASIEVCCDQGRPLTYSTCPFAAGQFPNRLADLLEAIYSRAGAPRPEGEMIPLIKRGIPEAINPWDVLRSLEEAGWLVQDINQQWKGRFWRVSPPNIVLTGKETAIAEGALGCAELELLNAEAGKASVEIVINAEGPWAVPVIGLVGSRIPELAEQLNWKIYQAKTPILQPAPACWPQEARTTTGRQFAGNWDPDLNSFALNRSSDASDWRLCRFVRNDDRDVYSIEANDKRFYSSQRVVALLEFGRRSRNAQFKWEESGVLAGRSGSHLPLPVAQWLRRTSFIQTGPEQRGNTAYLSGPV
ncbi:hypothetical protein [Halomonas mongoliensis]|uniref:hypothetical protein n=1 Tax=Halomonas mongoliensis TaxID=321265 RepID=UPI00403B0F44